MAEVVVWIDGRVVPAEAPEARISVLDRGFLYGDSVYEVLRTYERRPFALEEHLDRLDRSAAALGIACPERGEIARATKEAIEAVGADATYVRIVVTRGAGPIALDPARADRARLIVIAKPAELPPAEAYREGVAVAVVGHTRSGKGSVHPSVKSGNYLSSVLAVADAKARGAYEALLVDAVGRIPEGASSNVFVVRGRRIVTPALSVGLLGGITRMKVIEAARGAGIPVDEAVLWPIDLERADEAFLTSSVRGVVPVVRVDGATIGSGRPGPVTTRVMALYESLTRAG